MLERDATGTWVLAISSGSFEFLEKDAADGFVTLQPMIEVALGRHNQFVLGPPISAGDGTPMSPVLIALSNVRHPRFSSGSSSTPPCSVLCSGRPRQRVSS